MLDDAQGGMCGEMFGQCCHDAALQLVWLILPPSSGSLPFVSLFPSDMAHEEANVLLSDEPVQDVQEPSRWKSVLFLSMVAFAGVVALGWCGFHVAQSEAVAAKAVSSMEFTGFSELSERDVARATRVTPGPLLQAHYGLSNELLNKHLKRIARGNVKPCEDFSAEEKC